MRKEGERGEGRAPAHGRRRQPVSSAPFSFWPGFGLGNRAGR